MADSRERRGVDPKMETGGQFGYSPRCDLCGSYQHKTADHDAAEQRDKFFMTMRLLWAQRKFREKEQESR